MSIVISNISTFGKPDTEEHNYEVCINHKYITGFTHRRADGLAACLARAAAAVAAKEKEELDDTRARMENLHA